MPDGEPTNAELYRLIEDVRSDLNRMEGRYEAITEIVGKIQRQVDVQTAQRDAEIREIKEREDRHEAFHRERDRETRESEEAAREVETRKENRAATRAAIITAVVAVVSLVVGVAIGVVK